MKSFLFSGQGAQSPGMMHDLYQLNDNAHRVFDIADEVLGRSISSLCFTGSQDELNLTHNTQPCILAVDLAAYAAITDYGIKPDAMAGFSLGEYAALSAAGVISIEDAFRIVQVRADAMQEAVPFGKGAMAAIMKASAKEVDELCKLVPGYVVPVNFNSPVQIVVSGETEAVDALLALTKERKIRSVKLPVSAPFHSIMMEPARAKLVQFFQDIAFRDSSVPIYMNVDGKAHINANDIKDCVLHQTISPVQWVETLCNMSTSGIDTYIELGVGRTLSGFVSKTIESVQALQVTDNDSLKTTLEMLGV